MPCPWYQNGMCTSPKLPEASELVVSRERCLGGPEAYRLCKYYVEPEKEGRRGKRKGIERFSTPAPAEAQKYKPYPPIHVIPRKPSSACPFIKIINYAGGYLAYCRVLNRLLTKHEVSNCDRYWKTCPFYRIGREQP